MSGLQPGVSWRIVGGNCAGELRRAPAQTAPFAALRFDRVGKLVLALLRTSR
jgi:hypothetical protein